MPASAKHARRIIVADSSPLIALARLQKLDLLQKLFSQVLLTNVVLAECEARSDRDEGALVRLALRSKRWQLIEAPPAPTEWHIDAGEGSALSAALLHRAGVLMDDKLGRRLAGRLGLAVIGTAGVLVLAKRGGYLPEVRPCLDALVASGYFIGADVVGAALQQAGELA